MADEKDPWRPALAEQRVEAWDEKERSAERNANTEAPAAPPITAAARMPEPPVRKFSESADYQDQLSPQGDTGGHDRRPPVNRAATVSSYQTGLSSCEQCRHWRPAESLVAEALKIMPLRTMANSEAVREAERKESAQVAEEVLSHPALVDDAMRLPRDARSAVADARPSAYAYCGEHEMEGRFELLEIKNADGDCGSFNPKSSVQHPCETCAFFQTPTAELLALVQEPFTDAGTTGMRLFEEQVQKPLKDRADLELDEALRKQGFVTGTPVHFPYCARLYEPGTITLIGPLANRGRQCGFWTEAKATEPVPWQKAFTQVQGLRQKLEVFCANAPRGPAAGDVQLIIRDQEQAMSKDIDEATLPFVEAALEAMGFRPDEAQSIVSVLAVAQEEGAATAKWTKLGATVRLGAAQDEASQPEHDSNWQAEVDQGLREFRLTGTAMNPMFPVGVRLLAAGPYQLSVRVVIQNPDLPMAPPFDGTYAFSVNQYGTLTVQDPNAYFGYPRILVPGKWEVLTGIRQSEAPSFMWCIRPVVAETAGDSPVLGLFVRWLKGQYAWRR